MAELLLVSNPKRRKKKLYGAAAKAHAKKHRKHKKRHRAKAAAPKRRHKRRHHRPKNARSVGGAYVVGSAPIRRRKLNPHRRRRARYHRRRHHRRINPSLRGITSQIMPTVKAGAWGAAGALGLDALWGLLITNLPSLAAYLTNPYITFAAKAVGAVGVGAIGGKVARGRGRDLAVGAMTVVTHDFLKSTLQTMAPSLFGPGGTLALGAYLNDGGLGAYLNGLGGAAPIVGTATIPQAYLPFGNSSGQSGAGDGVYSEDRMGLDPWGMG